jgi:hypothetical protein
MQKLGPNGEKTPTFDNFEQQFDIEFREFRIEQRANEVVYQNARDHLEVVQLREQDKQIG